MHLKTLPSGAFETENLHFRSIDFDDKMAIYNLYSDPKVLQLEKSNPIHSLKEAENLIRLMKASHHDPHQLFWGVTLKDNQSLIGTCGFKNWDRSSSHAEIGGHLNSKYWGNGYATESLRALIHYGFTMMSLNKIYAMTNCQNDIVIKILNKYRFNLEGRLREHHYVNKTFTDVFVYSMLKREYLN
ncbi:GNAT family N-acetyltransferase [Evansella cellulosilytica]|uniref:GCN5-related N-acetyltransferase n=1 Tax=Evansella cellulosilytica (strain ATCC 21833 / DSM 2522 / FERM P-1141 / JCM 9156 / N-4) TaxID=649639 RepID=E6TQI1_EVAC2|nr:GNAT family protein [Evansella cellulosilytica]ADU30492.1 GCN5-related N-acetyltransferase [Evansella cellulosilytica DSM 2522]